MAPMPRRSWSSNPRGRPSGDPTALVNRIAALLAAHPGRAFRAQEVADELAEGDRLVVIRPLLRQLCASRRARKLARGLFAALESA